MEKDFSQLDTIIQAYQSKPGILIPLLQEVQNLLGYLSRDALRYIAEKMQIPVADIYGVATFYSMFKLKPQGKHIVRVCMGTACHVSDADEIKDALRKALQLQGDEDTTEDMQFTLVEVACLGCCSLAPVIMIDDVTFGKVAMEAIPKILQRFAAGEES
ncbi:MAG: NADH-quinone oxidoreductase subunit NuoE [Candidatus Cloacimonadaceae bacterium]|jgi:NADH:ubiquinone oxidoreductase subunit E|nr:NADH-quinone oxidoreductase subunit NuoE [Candidatus Cloacimonadota bacterium]MDY0127914.1 NADH-quinone oxidoreductase subunit NuoE [Candidatus Cloacimonadaceae bacterium]MCB5255486.1 NADH-quinone oxidoreductase subunit NuoE [Candidatus Cloacimonadota bacterium]MCK9178408.1 NADH-quinone oxidoreductase subunit NuoE [Candidatus Cloacimonadota bacterium]MCK9243024.1 NADH-quinone oxidoreductase subunit NuoE [Candidatus Cloacimonadota bacterium]